MRQLDVKCPVCGKPLYSYNSKTVYCDSCGYAGKFEDINNSEIREKGDVSDIRQI